MSRILPLVAIAALLASTAQAQAPKISVAPRVTPRVQVARPPVIAEQKVLARQSSFGPASRIVIAREAARIAADGDTSQALLRAHITQAGLGPLGEGDINALMASVMLQAGRDAADDIRSQIDAMKENESAKAAQRQNLERQKASASRPTRPPLALTAAPPVYNLDRSGKASLDAMIDNMKSDLDSMSEMGEAESLRLQMAMDRLSKMMSTLSNILEKIDDTSQTITQNLK